MRFILTGTASGVPVIHRRHASLVIEDGSQRVLVDAGEGCAAALLAAGIELASLTRVVISHTHADHVSGLPMLLQGMYLAGRTEPLPISVPPGRVQWFRDWLRGMYVFSEKWSFPFQVQQYGDIPATEEGLRIAPFPNRHLEKMRELAARHDVPAAAYSLHVSSRCCSVVISSDIAGLDDVAAAAAGSDVLIVDSAHVGQDEIFAFAAAHEKLTIICTHIPPEIEPGLMALRERSGEEVGGRVLYAYDGMQYLLEKKEE
ncbi:MAG: MBL fold metallo-hydrolase [Bacteroidetes bacterium]|nr:MBL fold metallo-hydrolase [Bacteroidota bacterium]